MYKNSPQIWVNNIKPLGVSLWHCLLSLYMIASYKRFLCLKCKYATSTHINITEELKTQKISYTIVTILIVPDSFVHKALVWGSNTLRLFLASFSVCNGPSSLVLFITYYCFTAIDAFRNVYWKCFCLFPQTF